MKILVHLLHKQQRMTNLLPIIMKRLVAPLLSIKLYLLFIYGILDIKQLVNNCTAYSGEKVKQLEKVFV